MKREIDLLVYEAPTYTEFISWNWLQNIVAKILANRINRKMKRYEYRLKREKYLKHLLTNH